MPTEGLVDSLVADLKPVTGPRFWRDVGLLALLAVIELAVYVAIGHMRPDIGAAMAEPSWW